MTFWPLCCKSEAILSKTFRPGHSCWSVHMGNFYPGYRHLGCKNRHLNNRASHMNTSNFYEGKNYEARSWKPSQPGLPGSYEEALKSLPHRRFWQPVTVHSQKCQNDQRKGEGAFCHQCFLRSEI